MEPLREGDVKLPDGTVVHVEAIEDPQGHHGDRVYDLARLAGPTGVADLAMNVDHYLYGHPRAGDAQP